MTATLFDRVWGAIRSAILLRRTHMLEAFLALEAMVWGAWVLNPAFDAFESIPRAYTLLGLLPEWFVGMVFLGHGVAAAYVLYRTWADESREVRRGYVHWCRRAALAGAGLWSVVLVSFALTVPTSTAVPVYFGLMLASMWVYVRLDWRYG